MPRGEVDLGLVWRTTGDGPPRLDRGNLFLIAAREAYRCGSLEGENRDFMARLAMSLRLSEVAARQLLEVARADAARGVLEPGKFEPNEVFRKACFMAEVDGQVDPKEKKLLEGLAHALGIPDKAIHSTLMQLAVRVEVVPSPFDAPSTEAVNMDSEAILDPSRKVPFDISGTLPVWARPRQEGGETAGIEGEATPKRPRGALLKKDPPGSSTLQEPGPQAMPPLPPGPRNWRVCRVHPERASRVGCPECRIGYCKECGHPVGKEVACPTCHSICLVPGEMERAEQTRELRERGIFPELSRVAGYPFVEGGTIWVLSVWAGCFYLAQSFAGGGPAGFWTLVLGRGVLVAYAFSALTRVSAGTFDRYSPDISDLSGFIAPLRLAGGAALAAWGPLVGVGLAFGGEILAGSLSSLFLVVLTGIWALVYSPAAFIVAGMTRSFWAPFNPLSGMQVIQGLGGFYWQTTGVYLVLEVVRFFLGLGFAMIPFLGAFLAGMSDSFFFLAEGCLLGLALFKRAPELGLE